MTLEERFDKVLKETGRAVDSDKIKIISIDSEYGSDMARVIIDITQKRCRKPYITWLLHVDTVRGSVYWDRSSFYRR